MVLVGITHTDTPVDVEYCVPKLLNLKLWENDSGKHWSASLVEKKH